MCYLISNVDNDSRVSSSQNSYHCVLATILDPSFIIKMLGCCLEDPHTVSKHILKLDAWVHSSVNYKELKETGSKREGMSSH